MSDPIAETLASLESLARERGWTIEDRHAIEHGLQVTVGDGTARLPVNLYSTGKVLVQGKAGPLREALVAWSNLRQAGPLRATPAHIGVDESGKGDVFGPLVIAGVVVTPETEGALARAGVRDSKTLAGARIVQLAGMIRAGFPCEVLALAPPAYNDAYETHGRNLNRLLAWGHARVIAVLHARTGVGRALSDQFGNPRLLPAALAAEGCAVALDQRPRAESDLAVAAASILARAAFVAAMDEYAHKLGCAVPLGASDPQIVPFGREIVRRWGARGLERIAKLHFQPVAEMLKG
jgi:ribonuclease HIII